MVRFTSAEVRSVLTSALHEELPVDGEPAANYLKRIVRLLKARHKSSIRADSFTRAWFKKLVKEHYDALLTEKPHSSKEFAVRTSKNEEEASIEELIDVVYDDKGTKDDHNTNLSQVIAFNLENKLCEYQIYAVEAGCSDEQNDALSKHSNSSDRNFVVYVA